MHLWCRMFEWLSSFSSQRTVRHIIVSIPTHRWENWGPESGDWQLTAGSLVGRLADLAVRHLPFAILNTLALVLRVKVDLWNSKWEGIMSSNILTDKIWGAVKSWRGGTLCSITDHYGLQPPYCWCPQQGLLASAGKPTHTTLAAAQCMDLDHAAQASLSLTMIPLPLPLPLACQVSLDNDMCQSWWHRDFGLVDLNSPVFCVLRSHLSLIPDTVFTKEYLQNRVYFHLFDFL